jgi:hypothetical protein
MKRHITDQEAADLVDIFGTWTKAKEDQADCVDSMIDIFECDADTAVDMLNQYCTAREMLSEKSVEIHNESACKLPWRMDGESGIVMLLAAGGYVAVCLLAGG